MPAAGGFAPLPLRCGGGENNTSAPLLQRVFESIAGQRGSAYDQTTQSAVGVENMAIARAITFDLYEANRRLANNMRPSTMTAATGMLPRWEAIFNQPFVPGDTEVVRRGRIAAAWAAIGQPNIDAVIKTGITAAIGSLFSGTILYQSPSTALVYWPGAANNTATLPWYSTIDHIDIQLTLSPPYENPDGSPNALFWATVGKMVPFLEATLPAWITYDWFLVSSSTGRIGFYLDEVNLDVEIFDI